MESTAQRQSQVHRILHMLPDLSLGGGQQVVLRNLRGLKPPYENYVCYLRPNREMEPLFLAAGVTLRYLPHGRIWMWPGTLCRLVKLIRDEGIDLVHIQGTPTDKLYGQTAAWWCGIPVVRTLHGMMPEPRSLRETLEHPRPRQILRWGKAWLQSVVDRFFDARTVAHVIAVSDGVYESWVNYLRTTGVDQNRVTVSYNGVAVEEYSKPDDSDGVEVLRRQLELDGCFPVLINIGRITGAKGQDLLVTMLPSIVREVPAIRLLLVGEGTLRQALEDRVGAMGLSQHVSFLGWRHDVADLLRVSDIFVFSSRFEGCPLTVLEAMAAAKPIVSVDIPGLSRVVKDGVNGRLVAGREPESFARTVMELARDGDTLRDMGLAGRRLVQERHDIRRSVQDLKRVYESVLTRRERDSNTMLGSRPRVPQSLDNKSGS